jgi:hypothetical protein
MNGILLPDEPPLATPLRACADGFYPAEATAELLIGHASCTCGEVLVNRYLRQVVHRRKSAPCVYRPAESDIRVSLG